MSIDAPHRLPVIRRPWLLLVFLLAGYLATTAINGLLRHARDADQFPLLGEARTYTFEPWHNPYRAYWHWHVIPNYDGDFLPIFEAATGRKSGPDFPIYRPEQLKEGRASFVYTPFVALAVSPLAPEPAELDARVQRYRERLPPEEVQDTEALEARAFRYFREQAADRVSVLNHVLWLLSAGLLFAITFHRTRITPWGVGLFLLAFLAFYPLAKALQLVQASVWIYTFLVVALFALQRGWLTVSGLALALGVSIKPHLVVVPVLLWFLPGFPRRVPLVCFGAVAAAALVSVVYAGWENSITYAFETLPILSSGYAYYPNQSFNGLLLRMLTDADPADFNLATPNTPIKIASSLLGLGLLGAAAWAAWPPAGGGTHRQALRLALLLAAATIASPVCWMHHLTAFLPAVALLMNDRLRLTGWWGGWRETAALAGFLLISSYFDGRALSGFPAAFLSILPFYGGALLVLVLGVRNREFAGDEAP